MPGPWASNGTPGVSMPATALPRRAMVVPGGNPRRRRATNRASPAGSPSKPRVI